MKTTGQHHKVSLTDRHERIKSIEDEVDAFLEKMQQAPWAKGERCRELHKLRGYCEQLRVDAESLKSGADGFGKGCVTISPESCILTREDDEGDINSIESEVGA